MNPLICQTAISGFFDYIKMCASKSASLPSRNHVAEILKDDTNDKNRINMEVIFQSTITCPNCGHQKVETMLTDACQYFYECEKCKQFLKRKQGDCCVFCSYGSVACPPIQQEKNCC